MTIESRSKNVFLLEPQSLAGWYRGRPTRREREREKEYMVLHRKWSNVSKTYTKMELRYCI